MKLTYFIGPSRRGFMRNRLYECGAHTRLFKEFLIKDKDFIEDKKSNIVDFSNRFYKSKVKNALGFTFFIGGKDKLESICPDQYIPKHFKARDKNDDNIWFVKPINGACGKGIIITRDPKSYLIKYGKEKVVIQKQIIPKLINERVWTVRHYIIIFKRNDNISLWIHNNGSIKLGIEKYDSNHFTSDMLITNSDWKERRERRGFKIPSDAIGMPLKYHKNYNKLFENMVEMYKEIKKKLLNYREKIRSNPIIRSKMINTVKNDICYHLIGVDLMFDKEDNPYIIEMNDGAQINYKPGVYKYFKYRERDGKNWRRKMLYDIFMNFIKRPLLNLEPVEEEFKKI